MITNTDRSGYFGASDVKTIMGNWQTETFAKWWMVKEGLVKNEFVTDAMMAGTYWEHRILEALELPMKFDRQIIIEPLKLRVNLDGETDTAIYECKTYKWENGFKVPKHYIQQVNVQMFATGKRSAYIVAYGLVEDDYKNYYLPVDLNRLELHEIKYDEKWVNEDYLPRLEYLARCLTEGEFPMKVFENGKRNRNKRN